jgi:Acetyltransferase (GNAT) family.
MTEPTLEFDEPPRPEDFRVVLDGVYAFIRAQTGYEPPRQVAYFFRDERGKIVGGVRGSLWGRAIHIDAVWVDEAQRGRGLGTKLMTAIEEYAASSGHPLVYLETASFQALPFYQGLDYEVFGELPEISNGETLFFMMKELSR